MTTSAASDPALHTLAQYAGILTHWQDAAGRPQRVADDVLRHLLQALELACSTPGQIRASMHQLEQDRHVRDGDLLVVRSGDVPRLQCKASGRWKLILESGQVRTGTIRQDRHGWISLDPIVEAGYHRLQLGALTIMLAVVPRRCPEVRRSHTGARRPWGLVAQIYSLFDATAQYPVWLQGGSFSSVGKLAVGAAHVGADALALSPAHAMFSADPDRYSPYSPSSRLLLNVCYGDPVEVLGGDMVRYTLNDWCHADIHAVPGYGQFRNWPQIATLRLRLLRDAFACFQRRGAGVLKRRLEAFRRDGGAALLDHAIYEALHAHYAPDLGPGHGWQDWPAELHDPSGQAVKDFARQHSNEVDFHIFAQWLARETLQQAQAGATAAGMSCGLISDLAIGTDPRGSHAWSLQNDILTSVSVGAPPDLYQAQGQDWGLTAFSPRGLRRGAYSAFIATLCASLAGAGGIRIDHIAGMERLWLVPTGGTAADGAYLTYPKHELLGLIALEASRHDAIVIGENLGTVSEALNQSLAERNMLGTSVLWFEQESPEQSEAGIADRESGGGKRPSVSSAEVAGVSFRSPERWAHSAIAMPSTHDLPTIHGWWQERDLQWHALLREHTPQERQTAQDERRAQRASLWSALHTDVADTYDDHGEAPEETPLDAVLAFVARTPAPLALFSMEDLLGVIDQPNMPGGDTGQRLVHHPNWLQQLPTRIDDVFSSTAVMERIRAINSARSRS